MKFALMRGRELKSASCCVGLHIQVRPHARAGVEIRPPAPDLSRLFVRPHARAGVEIVLQRVTGRAILRFALMRGRELKFSRPRASRHTCLFALMRGRELK